MRNRQERSQKGKKGHRRVKVSSLHLGEKGRGMKEDGEVSK